MSHQSGELSRESKHINLENGVMIAGREFVSWFRKYAWQRKRCFARKPNKRGGDEAAAKDEDHDRCDKGNQTAKWTRTTVGGSVVPLIAKKRGSKMGRHNWLFEMKKDEEKRLEV